MADDGYAAGWGVQAHYLDTAGAQREAPDTSVAAVIASLRRDDEADAPAAARPLVTRTPGAVDLPDVGPGATLVLEDGTDVGPVETLPPGLPLGYHRLVGADGVAITIAVGPGACHLDEDLRGWGWALQLYAARSRASWGIGDLADARAVGAWSRSAGGRPHLLLNPLHASNPGPVPEPSPYSAGSRCFRTPLYLRIEEIAGADRLGADLERLAQAGRALSTARLIDRPAVWTLKHEALERLWAGEGVASREDAFAAIAADAVLGAYVGYCTAVEQHGSRWMAWPVELRRPDGPAWSRFRRDHHDRLGFHAWLQRLVADQLDDLTSVVPVIHDLAVGTSAEGFDAWYWQDVFVLDGTHVGAPSDQFNTQGQDWSLPPLDPWRLRGAGYEPYIRMLRAACRGGSGVRIDHVMGLFRLFWIPPGAPPAAGVYVRQRAADLLDLLALESARAGAFVVGEDLGTVEAGVGDELRRRRLLSYRVLTMESRSVHDLPEQALASVTTHDMATLAGLWTGQDLTEQERLGLEPNVADTLAARAGLRDRLGVADDAPVPEVVVAAYAELAAAPCRLVVGQLDDAAGVPERPNMPGTVDEWPNWSLALPVPLEDLLASDTTGAVAESLAHPPGERAR